MVTGTSPGGLVECCFIIFSLSACVGREWMLISSSKTSLVGYVMSYAQAT